MSVRFQCTMAAVAVGFTFAGTAIAHGDGNGAAGAARAATFEQKTFGIAGEASKISRTIDIDMSDELRFIPATLELRVGETIRFRLRNKGDAVHEMVIGTLLALEEHAALMRRFPEMEHSEPYMAHVKPGGTEEIVWTFNRPGEFNYACLVAGHFEAGMVGTAIVSERS
ncbi:MAG: cupredoxin domain-containing protein [Casimicrobiaceae bacterium]